MSEVRSTADSLPRRVGGQASPRQEALAEQGRMGWLETECLEVRGQRPRRPVLGSKEQGRSQSPRSSWEAANPRGAKGGRKVEP
jgi:hypothetical protein